MQIDSLISMPSIFVLSLVMGLVLYWVGGKVGVKSDKHAAKIAPYACGEDLPPRKLQVDAERFLIYAVYFLIFDIVAFILATSMGTPGFLPSIYASIVLVAIIMLLPLGRMR